MKKYSILKLLVIFVFYWLLWPTKLWAVEFDHPELDSELTNFILSEHEKLKFTHTGEEDGEIKVFSLFENSNK